MAGLVRKLLSGSGMAPEVSRLGLLLLKSAMLPKPVSASKTARAVIQPASRLLRLSSAQTSSNTPSTPSPQKTETPY
ncbi:hypothetical protein Mhypo_02945 [Meiothermus hypogaeus]|uniref:Uncharacterized protein n=1 Tax=Meiothermus hypogaeus TaxID=884155 RepID=A0ABX9MIK3_9DEIN|nr:hypothetical protein Mhypo_02945 [Meiothermus hypogaeus]